MSRVLPSLLYSLTVTGSLALAVAAATPAAAAQYPTTILLSNIPGYPESAVPGEPGESFLPGDSLLVFRRIVGSPDGRWAVLAQMDSPPGTTETITIVDGQRFLRQGDPAPWAGAGQVCEALSQNFALRPDGATVTAVSTTDGVTSKWHLLERVNSTDSVLLSEGDPVPQLPGVAHGRLESPSYLNNGDIAYLSYRMTGAVTPDTDMAAFIGPSLLFQKGVTVPAGQLSSSGEAYDFVDPVTFFVTPDESNWLMTGNLTGNVFDSSVVVYNGSVVVQSRSVIPGTFFNQPVEVSSIFDATLDAGGNWMARGVNAVSIRGWAVRNSAVVGARNLPVIPGSNETWRNREGSFPFTMLASNSLGDYVVGGYTSEGITRDYVIILNGNTEVYRQGDPIDLDGNGLFDDDAFLRNVVAESAYLTDEKELQFSATVNNSSGVGYGAVIMSIDLSSSVGSPYCTAAPNSTGETSVLSGAGSKSVGDNDLTLTAANLPAGVIGYFIASQTQGFLVGPGGSSGNLCLGGSIGRYLGPGQVQSSGTTGEFTLSVDVTAIAQPTGNVAATPGETWNFQAWHRDTGTVATSNFTPGIAVTFE